MKTNLPGIFSLVAALLVGGVIDSVAQTVDRNRARELHQKAQRGEKLTPAEQAEYERAKAERSRKSAPAPAAASKPVESLTPLTELGSGKYKGETGGLYGEGRNEPPAAHREAALREARKIQPLDAAGKPSPEGKIVLLSIGMSNTTQEYAQFKQLAEADGARSPHVIIVDGAQGGQEASDWASPTKRDRQNRGEKQDPWEVLEQRLKRAGVTPQQVQVIWMKQARRSPARLGEFPKHAQALQDNQEELVHRFKKEFPNLRLTYLSSRIYAGYAQSLLSPEPYAYEGAFANRWSIQKQITGDPALNYDPARGEVRAPLLLWGPYLWADGGKARADGLRWMPEDFAADGTHPSNSGRQKVAEQLLQFFKTDPTAKGWFVRSGGR